MRHSDGAWLPRRHADDPPAPGRDSLGNLALMRPGDVRLMRAGSGIVYGEMNASGSEPEHHLRDA
ncbi:pirin family protein [Variovorax sp. YR752]|uniref:pirin family protein n=1 Tax=Variovorax sp. YR752 TaxID=1884383 RepID=UPI003137D594